MIVRSQAQCPVLSVTVGVVSLQLSKELYSHCSTPLSCINGKICPTKTVRTSVTSPEGAVRDWERPLWRGINSITEHLVNSLYTHILYSIHQCDLLLSGQEIEFLSVWLHLHLSVYI